MGKSVYLETTIPSYLTARPSRDLVTAARQQVTREWWETRRRFDLYVSEVVMEEAADGDPDAVRRRLDALAGLQVLRTTDEAADVAGTLLREGALPGEAEVDALHVAVAAVHGMDILLTWNLGHLANADTITAASRVLRSSGYEPPLVCTPDQLMGGYDA
jgi:predicted nucleic acid-binding protein